MVLSPGASSPAPTYPKAPLCEQQSGLLGHGSRTNLNKESECLKAASSAKGLVVAHCELMRKSGSYLFPYGFEVLCKLKMLKALRTCYFLY